MYGYNPDEMLGQVRLNLEPLLKNYAHKWGEKTKFKMMDIALTIGPQK